MSNNEFEGKIIDIHTHVFDLSYLPISIDLVKSLFYFQDDSVAKGFTSLIHFVLKKIDDNKGDITLDEYKLTITENEIKNHLVDGLIEGGSDPEIISVMNQIRLETPAIQNEFGIFSVIQTGNRVGILGTISHWDFFQLLYLLLTNEKRIFEYLENKTFPQPDVYVTHMLDANPHFNGNAQFSFQQQIDRMKQLVASSNKKLLAFIPFSPWRKDTLKNFIKPNIKDRKFIGVKFYPPFGYRPIENLDNIAPNLKGKEIDANCYDLFKFCVENEVPVMTHCTSSGFQSDEGFGLNSDPFYWHQLFETHPDLHGLRLILAHSGGGEAWFDENSNNNNFYNPDWKVGQPYGEKVYGLCVKYENIYCDVSYLDEILIQKNYDILLNRLIDLFNRNPDPKFYNKIIYGSDFHVLTVLKKHKQFYIKFLNLFSEPGLIKYQAKFFSENAIRVLKL